MFNWPKTSVEIIDWIVMRTAEADFRDPCPSVDHLKSRSKESLMEYQDDYNVNVSKHWTQNNQAGNHGHHYAKDISPAIFPK